MKNRRIICLLISGFAIVYGPWCFGGETTVPMIGLAEPWTSVYQVDKERPHHLVNREGRHLFIVNKTAWAYFGCNNPSGVLERAKAQGVNVLRVALEGTPYEEALDIEMWPWGGTRENPDWRSWNEEYWEVVERRIRLAGEQGIGFDLVLYLMLHPKEDEIAKQTPYWEEIIRRLGKYTNVLTWEIANEYTENESFQDAAGHYFKEHDPFHRPVCSSDGTTDDALWPHKSWMDLAIVHTCTGSGSPYRLQDWYLSIARNVRAYGKPAFNNESGRENRHGNNDGVHRRKQGWLWCAAGGYWTWHSWDGCEGIDDNDYRSPGAEFLKPMTEFFRSIPFWELNPNFTVFAINGDSVVYASLADENRDWVLAYLCTEESGENVTEAKASLMLPNGNYNMSYVDPVSLKTLREFEVRSQGYHDVQELVLPNFQDDLLVVVRKEDGDERIEIPGTQ